MCVCDGIGVINMKYTPLNNMNKCNPFGWFQVKITLHIGRDGINFFCHRCCCCCCCFCLKLQTMAKHKFTKCD